MNLGLTKRQKIIITSIILTIGLLSTQLVDFNLRFNFIVGLGFAAYILSVWALRDGLNFTKAVVLMILPTLFTLGFSSYYFVLPIRWLTRIPMAAFFGISFYLLLLAQNIFNVAAIRTIPLYRAASTATFLFTWVTALLFYNVIDSFNLLFIWNGVVVFLISLPLVIQSLWSVEMKDNVSVDVLIKSLIISLLVGEFALALSFWPPVTTLITTMWALQLSVVLFSFLGMILDDLRGKLSKREVRWYLAIGVSVLIASFLTTSWTG